MSRQIHLAVVALLVISVSASACTGIRLKTKDGAVVYARTLEFGAPIPPVVVAIPRDAKLTGMAPGGKAGLKWTARFTTLGMGTEGYELVADGLNEKGLGAGIFYHPGYAKYADLKPGEEGKSISALELATYLLTTCASVADVRAAMDAVIVSPVEVKEFGGVPPFHAIVHDASGGCAVIEFIGGKTVISDNPLGVITNSPTFDWHVTNLRNYVNLTVTNVPPIGIGALTLGQFGEGTGLLGLPGDFTPPSRFIRAVAFSQSVKPAADVEATVNDAFHVLNNFDIVPGYVRSGHGDKTTYDFTQWTTAADLENLRYYYRTFEDPKIRFVDFKRLDLSGMKVILHPLGDQRPSFQDDTAGLQK